MTPMSASILRHTVFHINCVLQLYSSVAGMAMTSQLGNYMRMKLQQTFRFVFMGYVTFDPNTGMTQTQANSLKPDSIQLC